MTVYFDQRESISSRFGDDDGKTLQVLADRYIGANPPAPFVYRVFHRSGVLQNEEGLYDLDFSGRLPHARNGQSAYACGLVWSDDERNLDVVLRCLGPIRVFFNGEQLYRSGVIDEVKPDAEIKLNLDFRKGWNVLWVRAVKTPAGFGCLFGADEAKVRILNVLAPFGGRAGQSGWSYSDPVDGDPLAGSAGSLAFAEESETGIHWYPRTGWSEEEKELLQLERMFGSHPGRTACGWTRIRSTDSGLPVRITGCTAGRLTLYADGKKVLEQEDSGEFSLNLNLAYGDHDLIAHSTCGGGRWGYTLDAAQGQGDGPEGSALVQPCPVKGTDDPWFYAGPLDGSKPFDAAETAQMKSIFRTESGGAAYWRLDAPEAWIRPYYENAMLSNKWTTGSATNYARWDYPLGVTMYGLLQTGRLLGRPDIVDYAVSHIRACTSMDEYARWDKEQYGFPSLNQQLVLTRMLDNCGSFGSAMLEAYSDCGDAPELRSIADRIADFILNRLERREDGAFYRQCPGEYSADTMWADDLYMSAPFLRRYARIAGRPDCLDEAARQFLLFENYLYMPEYGIMSHVYDFKYGMKTCIPWGRGNGWTLFSLSEVLEALPDSHPDRPALLDLFNRLCRGYAALQGESGLWRQVLTDPEAYEEASCTAMFTYAFARGVRFGWLEDRELFVRAATRGWKGITDHAIDRQGNVHGVCSGSRYSFTADYYKEDLRTVTNDNHGIGIMMLAGTEVMKLKIWLGAG